MTDVLVAEAGDVTHTRKLTDYWAQGEVTALTLGGLEDSGWWRRQLMRGCRVGYSGWLVFWGPSVWSGWPDCRCCLRGNPESRCLSITYSWWSGPCWCQWWRRCDFCYPRVKAQRSGDGEGGVFGGFEIRTVDDDDV